MRWGKPTQIHRTTAQKHALGDIRAQLYKGDRRCFHRPNTTTAVGLGDSLCREGRCFRESCAILSAHGSLGDAEPPLPQPALRNHAKNHMQHRLPKCVPEISVMEKNATAWEGAGYPWPANRVFTTREAQLCNPKSTKASHRPLLSSMDQHGPGHRRTAQSE